MLSSETFRKMSKLSKQIEEENKDNNMTTLQNNDYLNLLAELSTNYSLVKVNDPETSNYHFELRSNQDAK
jgi:hypothetical protein